MARDPQTKAERRRVRAGREAGQGDAGRRIATLERALRSQSAQSEEMLRKLTLLAEVIQSEGGLQRGLALRRQSVIPVDEPLALICQAQRSGGTLLARLFDGHPQCHAHPHELHIGARRPHTWPNLPLDEDPELWFAKLGEDKLAEIFAKGKRRVPLKAADRVNGEVLYPFLLPPAFQRRVFLDEVERRGPLESEREVLDCYMTSLFNGWLDNQNLRGEKRWVVAFSPRRAWGEGLGRFTSIYPDGRLISILRDPMSWFTSAQGRDPEADPATLLEVWKRSAREMLEAQSRLGERFYAVRFEDLVLDTAGAMERLAEWLEIDFDERLAVPTFNGYPVGPNSSFETSETGVVTEPVERYKRVLSPEQQAQIEGECGELYREALALTAREGAA
jgi:hypothetical protein